MGNLVVIAFDQLHQAEEARLKLQELQSEYLLDLADVVVAVKEKAGKAKLYHAGNLIADNVVFQGFCGSLANLRRSRRSCLPPLCGARLVGV